MRSILSNLFRGFRTTKTARPAWRAPRRATLLVESLEQRLVPTSVNQIGSTLLIENIAQNHALTLVQNGAGKLEVFDNGVLLNPNHLFNISTIKAVDVTAAGGDQVIVNDNFGMPFAPGTTITLAGSGAANSLTLTGDRTISGNETYVAGGASFTPGVIFVDNLTFKLDSTIASVNDFIPITGTLDVQTSGTNVVLTGSNGFTQTLSGMGFGGGDTLTYAGMPTVELDEYAASAHLTLDASAAASGEAFFLAHMHGAGDITVIQTTPSSVFTDVSSVVAPVANSALVVLEANAGAVSVEGNSSTSMFIGQAVAQGTSTKGIRANVEVIGVGSLFLSDNGDTSSQVVTVTQSTIDGTGLFGNNSASVSYIKVGTLTLQTSQGNDQYNVRSSLPGAAFTTPIAIDDFSTSGFIADVNLEPANQLNLRLFNEHPQVAARLFFFPGNGKVSTSNPAPGVEVIDINFPGELPSQLVVTGFSFIGE